MIVAIPVATDGSVGHSWGKAPTIGVAEVEAGAVASWRTVAVGWDQLHDAGTHGSHHARVMRFLQENSVAVVAASHVGPGMVRMLDSAGIRLVLVGPGPAQDLAVRAAAEAG